MGELRLGAKPWKTAENWISETRWHSRQETELEQREGYEQSLYRALNRTLARESPLYREVVEGTSRNTAWSQALRPLSARLQCFPFIL